MDDQWRSSWDWVQGDWRKKKLEQMWRTQHPLVSSVMSFVLHFSFLPFLLCVLGRGRGGSWAHSSYCVHHDYHPLKDTWGLKSAPLWTEVAKVMELEVIACCFSVPTVANHSQLQPAEKDCLYTMHRFMKVFADRILLIIMTMKRITLFWMCLAIFFIWWMNGQHYTLCNVLIKNK